ncbi:hypothetical protein CKF54_00935 [Psittacicella hinzii]|uniref:site-specific DNA-methyltransferase (adenine-specific) n=1 Tax=Psittacicella hinzii TaxID=2028575 RepID=A0A3A1YAX8_9GAMM|nr:DNA adenine methylase [Psittacicella hinzii]RIY34338.1 hypothetical protein CKF54_00935 [Psittacicella hinzii]
MKIYNKAPVPYFGQKRYFLKDVKAFLQKVISNSDGAGYTIVDLFGGTGLLAHNAKRWFPEAKVVYNDFDHYTNELANISVARSNWSDITRIIGENKPSRMGKLDDKNILSEIKNWLNNQEVNGGGGKLPLPVCLVSLFGQHCLK